MTHAAKRKLPMIRYPVDDIAEWVDFDQGLFKMHGRDTIDLKISTARRDLPLLRQMWLAKQSEVTSAYGGILAHTLK